MVQEPIVGPLLCSSDAFLLGKAPIPLVMLHGGDCGLDSIWPGANSEMLF